MKKIIFLKNAAIAASVMMFLGLSSGCKETEDPIVENEFVVTFDTDGGSAVASQTIKEGGKVTKPADPVKDDFTFDAWYREAGLQNEWNFDAGTVTGDMTLYAGWDAIPGIDEFVVVFQSNGGTSVPKQNVADGGKVTEPTPPTKDGFIFDAWYKEEGLVNKWNFDAETVTGSMALYAGWKEHEYEVAFETNGGSAVPSQYITMGGKVIKPEDPTKDGFVLVAWYKEEGLENEWNFDIETISQDTTLYARWVTEGMANVTLQVGNMYLDDFYAEIGKKMTKPADPVFKQLTFVKWYSDITLTNEYDFNSENVLGDITLYAGCTINTGMVEVGTGTFTMHGTGGTNNGSVPHDVTITKNFSIGKYTVTQALWTYVMGTTVVELGSGDESSGVGPDHPIIYTTKQDALDFCVALSTATGKTYRLPTEAEWDYALRGGTVGNLDNDGNEYTYAGTNDPNEMWNGNAGGATVKPVGGKAPNNLGLYDMLGNVFEWVSDMYGTFTGEARTNPEGPDSLVGGWEGALMNRGGNRSSGSAGGGIVMTRRDPVAAANANVRSNLQGFRIAMDGKE